MNSKNIGRIVAGGLTVLGLCLASSCTTTGNNAAILQPRKGVSDPYAKRNHTKAVVPTPKQKNKTDFNFNEPLIAEVTPKVEVKEVPFVVDTPPPVDPPHLDIPPVDTPKPLLYSVQKNDTLWGISKRAKVSVNELADLNGIKKDDVLKVGQELQIPPGGVLPLVDAPSKSNTPKVGSYYTVKRGDTLSGIASRYSMSIKELKAMNSLKSDRIIIGQKLALKEGVKIEPPTKLTASVPADGIHVVQSGESLWKIAKMYGMSINNLKAVNGLTGSNLSVGQKLKVTGEAKTIKTAVTGNAPVKNNNVSAGGTYTVQNGDSLWKIANKHGVKVNELKEANNMTTTNLDVGQKLVIPGTDGKAPAPAPESETAKGNNGGAAKPAPGNRPKVMLPHFVEEGNETLKSIAEMYDSRVDWIIDANPGIKSDADLKRVKEIQVPVVEIQLQGG